jgi:hypothetical protein
MRRQRIVEIAVGCFETGSEVRVVRFEEGTSVVAEEARPCWNISSARGGSCRS